MYDLNHITIKQNCSTVKCLSIIIYLPTATLEILRLRFLKLCQIHILYIQQFCINFEGDFKHKSFNNLEYSYFAIRVEGIYYNWYIYTVL